VRTAEGGLFCIFTKKITGLARIVAESEKDSVIRQFSFDIWKNKAENRAQHLASKVFRSRQSLDGHQFVFPLP